VFFSLSIGSELQTSKSAFGASTTYAGLDAPLAGIIASGDRLLALSMSPEDMTAIFFVFAGTTAVTADPVLPPNSIPSGRHY
jgi:hypothetical protein